MVPRWFVLVALTLPGVAPPSRAAGQEVTVRDLTEDPDVRGAVQAYFKRNRELREALESDKPVYLAQILHYTTPGKGPARETLKVTHYKYEGDVAVLTLLDWKDPRDPKVRKPPREAPDCPAPFGADERKFIARVLEKNHARLSTKENDKALRRLPDALRRPRDGKDGLVWDLQLQSINSPEHPIIGRLYRHRVVKLFFREKDSPKTHTVLLDLTTERALGADYRPIRKP